MPLALFPLCYGLKDAPSAKTRSVLRPSTSLTTSATSLEL